MHWYVDFEDPVPDADSVPTLYEWCGGLPALTRMTRIFFEKHVPEDPLLAPLFANMPADHPERVAKWLGEVFGGPDRYSRDYGGAGRMTERHLNHGFSEAARARWVDLMSQSADEAKLPSDPEFRAAFRSYLEWGSRVATETSQKGAQVPPNPQMPHWSWLDTAAPGSRAPITSAQEPDGETPLTLPGENEPVAFEEHIKPMFRERDRRSMSFAFDLWKFDDVAKQAEAILRRLEDGSMPCDEAWPKQQIEVFRRWIETGKPESLTANTTKA
jgi:truncated hemoglobin YjbI